VIDQKKKVPLSVGHTVDVGRGGGGTSEVDDGRVHIQMLEQEEEEEQEDGRSSHSSDSLHQLDY
jgi:hypothetical protein